MTYYAKLKRLQKSDNAPHQDIYNSSLVRKCDLIGTFVSLLDILISPECLERGKLVRREWISLLQISRCHEHSRMYLYTKQSQATVAELAHVEERRMFECEAMTYDVGLIHTHIELSHIGENVTHTLDDVGVHQLAVRFSF